MTFTPENLPILLSSEAITAQSGSSFTLSFWFLSAERQKALNNFYAFCRVVDDAVDDYPAEQARQLLDFWKDEVAKIPQGLATHTVTRALQETVREFKIPLRYLELLIEGCEMDLEKKRYQTYEELLEYCYRVAAVIGLTCMRIFGASGPEAEKSAEELGLALQLTNILRDVREDAERGRIYLPLEDLQRYRVTETEILAGPVNSRMKVLFKLQADRAQVFYDRAFTKMKQQARKPLIAAWIMGKVYHAVLQKIRARHFDVYPKKIKISKIRKLAIAFREWVRP